MIREVFEVGSKLHIMHKCNVVLNRISNAADTLATGVQATEILSTEYTSLGI
jgi:hypothetical protein